MYIPVYTTIHDHADRGPGRRDRVAAVLVTGAVASVLGDTLLAFVIWRRLRAADVSVGMRIGFLVRVAAAALVASAALFIPGLPDLAAATLAGVLFLGVGQLIGMLPPELRDAIGPRSPLAWRRGR